MIIVSQWFRFFSNEPFLIWRHWGIQSHNFVIVSHPRIMSPFEGISRFFGKVLDLPTFLTTGFLKFSTSEALITFTYTLLPLLFCAHHKNCKYCWPLWGFNFQQVSWQTHLREGVFLSSKYFCCWFRFSSI